ncbi:M1 family metallopeptidase [Pseudoduganella lutea]|uniref:M1 family peptidase n=1 Tax=Pseudoduganella lutea TaxID=321985 RepID=A0A4P6KU28_9BURK|nr:M1 family metallopeptidase [Pseudoduganella lutea]QBE62581.1 M1 family peptidase [Pseudoduganella lutea]
MRVPHSLIVAAAAAVVALVQPALLAQGSPPAARQEIPFAPPHAAAVATPSAATAWGGPRTGTEPTLSNRVANYRIEARLDPVRHTIEGRQQLTWRNRSDRAVHSVYLHLYLNAFRNGDSTFMTELRAQGLTDGMGEGEWGYIDLRHVRQGATDVPWTFVQPDGGPHTDRTVVRLDLPQSVAPGASTTLDIAFFDQLPRVTARTGHFGTFHLVAQWFPKIGVLELPGERGATAPRWNVHEYHTDSEYYADFGHYDVKLTVPKGYTVGATGALQGKPVESGGHVTHHYAQGDVHDFAWTADNRTAPPLRATWTAPGGKPVDITVLYPPDYASNAAPALEMTKKSLDYFAGKLGPYPYDTLTVVIAPFNAAHAGSMEYPTFFTTDSVRDVSPGTRDRYDLDFVTVHEFAHMYFHGIVASNEFEEPMLDEGVNEYWNVRMLGQRPASLPVLASLLKGGGAFAFGGFPGERFDAPREEPADPIGANAYDRLEGVGPAYSRTAVMLHDLQAQLGTEVMDRAFREYYRRWQFRHPSAADLRETIAEVSGQRALVERVFAQQVYAVQKVDDRIASLTSEEVAPQPGLAARGGKLVEVTPAMLATAPSTPPRYRTTVVVRRRGAAVPQVLVVKFADGGRETVRWNGDAPWRRFEWVKGVPAVAAELDPERRHLLDTNKLDDTRTLEADAQATRRWTMDFAAVFQALLALVAAI